MITQPISTLVCFFGYPLLPVRTSYVNVPYYVNLNLIYKTGPVRPRGVCDLALHRVDVRADRAGAAAEGGALAAAQGDHAIPTPPGYLDQARHRR